MTGKPEVWMRGPIEGVPPLLMPAAHALLGVGEDVDAAVRDLSPEVLWSRPAGAASVGFHLRHLAGSLDRLLTYARGEALTEAQLAFLRAEAEPGDPPETADALLAALHAGVDRALAQLRATDPATLTEPRGVGRLQLPSNVIGLLFHAAEHSTRHTGQIITTARIARALAEEGASPGTPS